MSKFGGDTLQLMERTTGTDRCRLKSCCLVLRYRWFFQYTTREKQRVGGISDSWSW